jgi:hypothetical protein
MEEYLKKLDAYIDLKIEYSKSQYELNHQQAVWLRQAKSEMEIALLLLIRRDNDLTPNK